MHLARLKNNIQPQPSDRIHNLPCQRIFHRQFLPYASALGSGSGGIEIDRVETLPVFMAICVGGCGGAELGLHGLIGLGVLARSGGRYVGGADDGGGEFRWVHF